MSKINNIESVELLLEYQKILEQKVIDLRAEACVCAGKVRAIKKAITAEQINEVEEKKKVEATWSMKLQPHLKLQSTLDNHDDSLMDMVQNVK